MAISPAGDVAYLVDEASGMLELHAITSGKLTSNALQSVSTVPASASGYTAVRAAEVTLHPNHSFLYVSTRLDQSDDAGNATSLDGYIMVYAVGAGGQVTALDSTEVGPEPRSFAIDPTGKFLFVGNLHASADNVVEYRIGSDGKLTKASSVTIANPYFVAAIDLGQ
jgi:6-phosphogluconolactonase